MTANRAGAEPTAEEMMAVLNRLDPATKAAMVEVVNAQSWGQVAKGTTEHLLSVLESMRALAAEQPADPRTHEPDEFHEYRIECKVCGEPGTFQLSIEPQRAQGSAARGGGRP